MCKTYNRVSDYCNYSNSGTIAIMCYTCTMKKMIILGLVPISELVKVTGTSASNIQKTYINNINGINKDKMLEALSIGAYMMEKKLNQKM